jgi:hypothetical protein
LPRAVPARPYELGDLLVYPEHTILELLYVFLERDDGPDGVPGEGLQVVEGEDVRGVAHGEHEPAVLDFQRERRIFAQRLLAQERYRRWVHRILGKRYVLESARLGYGPRQVLLRDEAQGEQDLTYTLVVRPLGFQAGPELLLAQFAPGD